MPRLLLLCLLAVLLAAGCGGSTDVDADPVGEAITPRPGNDATRIVVGSKEFTESRVLAEIYAQTLQAAGYSASTQLDVGDEKTNLAAVRERRIGAYPEYTATALTSFFGVPLAEVPRDTPDAFADARAGFARIGLTALPPAPLNDSQGVGMRVEDADRLGIRTISDLRRHAPRMTIAGAPECRTRPDCLPGLRRRYGLRFGRFAAVAPDDRYKRLDSGDADVAVVFTTDGQLSRGSYRVLRDDRRLFPAYHPMLVLDAGLARKAGPDLARAVSLVQADLTTSVMQGLNAAVDLDGRSPRRTAREYLDAYGLVNR
ncbi:MAG TPA: glycine betaine ABC transporter substrate-binding protein [Solirubrobacteraceae bacterium]|jgi:osmoprotectant transport system substrate-binding protein